MTGADLPRANDDCLICRHNADEDLPVRDQIWRSGHWRVAHAFDTALPGWLVVLSARHVAALDELDPTAAQELGLLLHSLSSALRATTGCEKTYVMSFGEAEGFSHLHVHVVPRTKGDGLRGFFWPRTKYGDREIHEYGDRIRDALGGTA